MLVYDVFFNSLSNSVVSFDCSNMRFTKWEPDNDHRQRLQSNSSDIRSSDHVSLVHCLLS